VAKYFILDKTFTAGTEWRVEDDKFYVVKAIGTDATEDIHFTYDRWKSPSIIDVVAPLRLTTTNLMGPLALNELYYVLPPKVPFSIVGPSGTRLRFIGQIGCLAPGETLPSPHVTRYEVQPKKYREYRQQVYQLDTDEPFAAGSERLAWTIETTGRERFTFDHVWMLSYENITQTINPSDMGVIWLKDTERFDIVDTEMGPLGVDALSMPRPPSSTNMVPFTFKEKPIVLEPLQRLDVYIRNNTTTAWTPPAGARITFTLTALSVYELLG